MLTHTKLKELLEYDPETGNWIWQVDRLPGASKGQTAGSVHRNGYRYLCVDKVQYQSSRLAWFYMTKQWPSKQIDHINRISIDDRWENLREVTPSENQCNRGMPKNNKSGVKGVVWHKQKSKWMAQIRVNNKNIYLGIYDDIEDAKIARSLGEERFHR